MLKLDGRPAQWVFDRGQLGGAPGLVAAVISSDTPESRLDRASLVQAIDAQLRRAIPGLPAPEWSQVIAEQRATFACVPGLERPATGPVAPRLYLAGDYTDPELPATLESPRAAAWLRRGRFLPRSSDGLQRSRPLAQHELLDLAGRRSSAAARTRPSSAP